MYSVARYITSNKNDIKSMCDIGKAERAERSGLPRFFFGYFLCSNDKESNNKILI
jgi:hypothetical protein